MSENKEVFECKQFEVKQTASLMKVNTDAILLGAWTPVAGCKKILDVGTGTGIIALMLAQKSGIETIITGVEIDQKSASEARENFANSKWQNRLIAIHSSIQQFSQTEEKFDLIVSNPPFFSGGTLSINENKNNVKHTVKLSHGDLLASLKKLLSADGEVALILPYIEGERFLELACRSGLFTKQVTEVKSKKSLPIERILIRLVKKKTTPQRNQLVMLRESKRRIYTEEYFDLIKDFYMFPSAKIKR